MKSSTNKQEATSFLGLSDPLLPLLNSTANSDKTFSKKETQPDDKMVQLASVRSATAASAASPTSVSSDSNALSMAILSKSLVTYAGFPKDTNLTIQSAISSKDTKATSTAHISYGPDSPSLREIKEIEADLKAISQKYDADTIEEKNQTALIPRGDSEEEKRIITLFNAAVDAIKEANFDLLEVIVGPKLFLQEQKYREKLREKQWSWIRLEHEKMFYQRANEILEKLFLSYKRIQENHYLLNGRANDLRCTIETVIKPALERLEKNKVLLENDLSTYQQAYSKSSLHAGDNKDSKDGLSKKQKLLIKQEIQRIEKELSELDLPDSFPIEDYRQFTHLLKTHNLAVANEIKLNADYIRDIEQGGYRLEIKYTVPAIAEIQPNVVYLYLFEIKNIGMDGIEKSYWSLRFKVKNLDNIIQEVVLNPHFQENSQAINTLEIIINSLRKREDIKQEQKTKLWQKIEKFGFFNKEHGYQKYLNEICIKHHIQSLEQDASLILGKNHITYFMERLEVELNAYIKELYNRLKSTLERTADQLKKGNVNNLIQEQVRIRYLTPLLKYHETFLSELKEDFFQGKDPKPCFDKFKLDGDVLELYEHLPVKRLCKELDQKCIVAESEKNSLEKLRFKSKKDEEEKFQKNAIVWLSRNYSKLPKSYTRSHKVEYLVNESIAAVLWSEQENLEEIYRRQRNFLHMRSKTNNDGVDSKDVGGNSLMHYAMKVYARFLVRIGHKDATSEERQTVENLRKIIELLHVGGCSPYWLNDEMKNAYDIGNEIGKATWVAKFGELLTPKHEEKYRHYVLPDWPLIRFGLENLSTISNGATVLKNELLEYCQETERQLNGWLSFLYRLFLSLTIKLSRRLDVSKYMLQLYIGQREINDAPLLDTIKELVPLAKKGPLGNSSLCSHLSNASQQITDKRLFIFKTELEELKEVIVASHFKTNDVIRKKDEELTAMRKEKVEQDALNHAEKSALLAEKKAMQKEMDQLRAELALKNRTIAAKESDDTCLQTTSVQPVQKGITDEKFSSLSAAKLPVQNNLDEKNVSLPYVSENSEAITSANAVLLEIVNATDLSMALETQLAGQPQLVKATALPWPVLFKGPDLNVAKCIQAPKNDQNSTATSSSSLTISIQAS